MLIKDYLKQFRSDLPFQTVEAKQKYERHFLFGPSGVPAWLRAQESENPGYIAFNAVAAKVANADPLDSGFIPCPDEIQAACDMLQIATLEDFPIVINSLSQIGGVIRSLLVDEPAFSDEDLIDCDMEGVVEAIKACLPCEESCVFWQTDLSFRAIKAEAQGQLSKLRAARYEYKPEVRDCEDFVRIVCGEFSEWGLGNAAVFACEYNIYNAENDLIGAHAVNIVILADSETEFRAVLMEPQTNMIVPNNYSPAPGGVRIGIRRVVC